MATKFMRANLLSLSRRLTAQGTNVQQHQQRNISAAAATAKKATNDARTKSKVDFANSTGSGFLKMRGWQIHSYGDVDELQFGDHLKTPQIRCASDCLVRVRGTTVNPIDVLMLRGYGATVLNAMRCNRDTIEFPITLGREFCGTLVQCGMAVSNRELRVGQRVWGVVPLQHNGAHAEYVTVPDYCLSAAPDNLTDEEAAATLYAGLTAWSGLYITGQLAGVYGAMSASGGGAHKRVLVLGGSGSVGSSAIQMLKAHGVEVLATCSENATELVIGYGADHVVDYSNPIAMETLKRFAPYDIILDCAGQGGAYAENLKFKYHQYITFSSPLLRNIDNKGLGLGLLYNLVDLVEGNAKSLQQHGGVLKYGFFAPAPQGIEFLKKLVEQRKLIPTIDSSFELPQLREAFSKVQSGHLRGKVIVNF